MNPSPDGPTIVNVDDGEWTGEDDDGGRWRRLARAAGGIDIGCTLEEIPPGGRPARYHFHLSNEEALFVVEGRGTLRTPDGDRPIGAGDYVAFPAGEAGSHAVENTSTDRLRCLLFSTMRDPDVVVYPDDGEFYVDDLGGPYALTEPDG